MTRVSTSHREQLREEFSKVPKHRFAQMVQRTFWGLLVAACGPALHLWIVDLPWWIIVGFVAVGMVTASGQLMMAPVRFVLASLKDLLATVRGK